MSFNYREHLPFKEGSVDVGGGLRLHYFEHGPADAPVILLLHGNPTWSFFYRGLIKVLGQHFRVLAPDHIGCGLSDRSPGRSFRAADRVAHLATLLAEKKIERFSLVMHDWGGPIGSRLAVNNPARIERLVYLNTTLTDVDELPGFIRLAARSGVGRLLTETSAHFVKLMLRFGVARRLPREIEAGYLFPYRTRQDRRVIWEFVQDIPFVPTHHSRTDLEQLARDLHQLRDHPVLIVWGLRDPCFHRAMLTQVNGHFPKARVVELPNASHLVLEDEGQAVCREIEKFFVSKETAPLTEPPRFDDARGLYGALVRFSEANPGVDAAIVPAPERVLKLGSSGSEAQSYRKVTFSQLVQSIRQYERGLSSLGLSEGDRVLMLVPPGIEFLALSYAVMGRGAIPCFLDPGMGRELLLRCLDDLSPHAIIGAPKAQLLRLLRPKLFSKVKFNVVASDLPVPGAVTLNILRRFSNAPLAAVTRKADAPALIAFTSGATGTPKGVIFTAEMLEAQIKIFSAELALRPGTRDLPLLPIFSLFSAALGVTSIFPPLDPAAPLALDPRIITALINNFSVTSSFGSPTLWQKIGDFCAQRQIHLKTLERIYTAGVPVPEKVIRLLKHIAPHAVVLTPYGATEALPVTVLHDEFILSGEAVRAVGGESGTPVGRPVAGVECSIMEPSDGAVAATEEIRFLPPLHIGEIIVRGPNVSPAYLNRPDANRRGKIKGEGTFWHRMGDVGYRDADGNLYYCGRKAHVVKAGGKIFYSDPVERIFNGHPRVRRTALVGLHGGAEAALVIEPLPDAFPRSPGEIDRMIGELRELGASHPTTAAITKFFFHPSFPVDARHNAKIFRDRLGQWASAQDSRARAANG